MSGFMTLQALAAVSDLCFCRCKAVSVVHKDKQAIASHLYVPGAEEELSVQVALLDRVHVSDNDLLQGRRIPTDRRIIVLRTGMCAYLAVGACSDTHHGEVLEVLAPNSTGTNLHIGAVHT